MKELLRRLHEEFPTEEGVRHNITLKDDNLLLTVFHNDKWYSFTFDNDDLNNVENSVQIIVEAIRNWPHESF